MKKIYFKKVDINHKKILFKWYNLKSVLRSSLKGKKFTFQEHNKWISKQLTSDNILKIIYFSKNPIGVIRLEKKRVLYLISYMIVPKFRRKGFAFKAIKKIISELKNKNIKKIVAIVKKDNTPSIKIFSKLKFRQINNMKNKRLLKFEYKL